MPEKRDHDFHLWTTGLNYAWLRREAKRQDRSMNAVLNRLITQARIESIEDDPEIERDEVGAFRTGKACKGCA